MGEILLNDIKRRLEQIMQTLDETSSEIGDVAGLVDEMQKDNGASIEGFIKQIDKYGKER